MLASYVKDKNNANRSGKTPLHYAAIYNQLSICQYLMNDKEVKHQEDNIGMTPFQYAVCSKRGHLDICKLIASCMEDKNAIFQGDNSGLTPFHHAAKHGHLDICKFIASCMEHKNSILQKDNYGRRPFYYAAIYGHLDICKLIATCVEDKNPVELTAKDFQKYF